MVAILENCRRFGPVKVAILVTVIILGRSGDSKIATVADFRPIRVAILLSVVVSGRSKLGPLSLAKDSYPQPRGSCTRIDKYSHGRVLMQEARKIAASANGMRHEKTHDMSDMSPWPKNGPLSVGGQQGPHHGAGVGFEAVRTPSRLLGGLCGAHLPRSLGPFVELR